MGLGKQGEMKMRKLLRAAAIAAGLFAMSTITAFAANGWVQENGQWVYYDRDSKVYNEWKTGADGSYYYLGGSGYMTVNDFVDDDRFVGADGKMVTNAWRQINSKWYYFDSNGRMTRERSRQIDGAWYYFDYDGAMQTGWVEEDDDYYYYDPSSGKMIANTWKQLLPPEEVYDDDNSGPQYTDGTYWFYFTSSGRACKAEGSGDYREMTINGNRYCFDSYGRMMTGREILDEISKYPSRHVVLTGGEPSLFIDSDFVQSLHGQGRYVAVETNGTHPLPAEVDWITCSPKVGLAAVPDDAAKIRIARCDELKVVYVGQDMSVYESIQADHHFLQPCDTGDSIRNAALITGSINYCKSHPKWRLSLQTHKLLDIK